MLPQRGRHPVLHDPAGIHHGDPVGDREETGQVVGDHRHGEVLAGTQLGQQRQHPLLGDQVEPGGGLVGHHERRLAGEREADGDALPHAAGKLVRVGREDVGVEVHELDQLPGAGLGRTGRRPGVQPDGLDELGLDPVNRVSPPIVATRYI